MQDGSNDMKAEWVTGGQEICKWNLLLSLKIMTLNLKKVLEVMMVSTDERFYQSPQFSQAGRLIVLNGYRKRTYVIYPGDYNLLTMIYFLSL